MDVYIIDKLPVLVVIHISMCAKFACCVNYLAARVAVVVVDVLVWRYLAAFQYCAERQH